MVSLAACTGEPSGEEETNAWTVSSPDGAVEATIARDVTDGTLTYRVEREGVTYLEASPLGITYEDESFVEGLTVSGSTTDTVIDDYVSLTGKASERSFAAHALTLSLANAGGAELDLLFRVADDGVAFRYRRPGEGSATLTAEGTGFTVPAGAIGWIQPYDLYFGMWPAYERTYNRVEAGADGSNDGMEFLDDGWGFPALFRLDPTRDDRWLMVTEAELTAANAATRMAQEVEGTTYRVRLPSPEEGNGEGEVEPSAELPWLTPWRVIILGSLETVVESTLVDDLSSPPAAPLEDYAAWVTPGRTAWSWLVQGTGNAALQREYVDFAAELGWEYVLVDAGWDQWPAPETELPELVTYAEARDVSVLIWYNSGGDHNAAPASPKDRMDDPTVRRAELAQIADWGVRGIKVDFFVSDKQDRIQQYLGILEDAAAEELMVSFHGCTLPRGWQRTYPHLMTMEAVMGGELYRGNVGPTALHNVRLAYTRNVVGSMDYTPMTFELALDLQQIPYAHQLALGVVFESAWQSLADRADADPTAGFRALIGAFPFAGDYLAALPTVWDQTEWLAGDPDTGVVLARRHGEVWYVAGINGLDAALEVDVALDFLAAGGYEARRIETGADPATLVEALSSLTAVDHLTLTLPARDGFVTVLTPQ